jgi:hypothetical protein
LYCTLVIMSFSTIFWHKSFSGHYPTDESFFLPFLQITLLMLFFLVEHGMQALICHHLGRSWRRSGEQVSLPVHI